MTNLASKRERPLSPFMIGPHYRPQLTSMTSIFHRITGVLLSLGALAMVGWLLAVAAGPDSYQHFANLASSWFGLAVGAGLIFAIVYHWLNGVRHLAWDVGVGLELGRAYASGWFVVGATAVLTVALVLLMLRGVAP